MANKRLSFEKFRVTLNGGTFDIPIVFDDSITEASAIIVENIPGFAPITVSKTIDGSTRVKYIRIPVKGGYVVVKLITARRRKAFDAEIRKLRAGPDITLQHLMYSFIFLTP